MVQTLESQIAELEKEAERKSKEAQRDKEKRREAVTARQDAQEEANRLKDRITQLESDLNRLRESDSEGHDVAYRRRETLSDRRLAALLERLRSLHAPPEGALTATVQDEVPRVVSDLLGDRSVLVADAAPCIVVADDSGIVSLALCPPVLPTIEPTWSDRFTLDPQWFEPEGRFVLVFMRANLFAAGIYEGREQISFKGFQPKVGRRHSKGGFSQGRFERIREEQIADHVKRCREALKEFMGDERRLYLVGQREMIDALADDFHPEATATVDATGAPREALEDAFQTFWTTELRVL